MNDRTSTIPIPALMRARPMWRGFPIPYIALTRGDGTSDFRVVDERRRREVMTTRACQLCGLPLLHSIFFTAGIAATAANQFWEPAMHLDCMVFAMQTCPFIIGKAEHADLAETQARNPGVRIGPDSTYSHIREPIWIITKTGNYTLFRPPAFLAHACEPIGRFACEPEKLTPADWIGIRQHLLKL